MVSYSAIPVAIALEKILSMPSLRGLSYVCTRRLFEGGCSISTSAFAASGCPINDDEGKRDAVHVPTMADVVWERKSRRLVEGVGEPISSSILGCCEDDVSLPNENATIVTVDDWRTTRTNIAAERRRKRVSFIISGREVSMHVLACYI